MNRSVATLTIVALASGDTTPRPIALAATAAAVSLLKRRRVSGRVSITDFSSKPITQSATLTPPNLHGVERNEVVEPVTVALLDFR